MKSGSLSDRKNISRWLSAYFIAIANGISVTDVLRAVGIDVAPYCGDCWNDRSKWTLVSDKSKGKFWVCKCYGKFIGFEIK